MKYIRMMLAVTMAVLVTSCAGVVPWNNQNNAGIEEWSVSYKDGAIEKVHYVNGKELGGSDIAIQLADGTVLNFTGSDIKAFGGQELRSIVEKAIVDQVGSVAPEVVDAIIKAIKGGTAL